MSNVIPFKRERVDETLVLASKIRRAAQALLVAIDELDDDGYQQGSDAIGHCLLDLGRLHDSWRIDRLPYPEPSWSEVHEFTEGISEDNEPGGAA